MAAATAEKTWEQQWLYEERGWATDDLTKGLSRLPITEALTKRYLRTNLTNLTNMLVVDVDDDDAERTVKMLAWDDHALPEPNWLTINPATGHGHIGYWLSAPVPTTEMARLKPLKFMAAIHEGLRQIVPGDPGYSNYITRNPLHPGQHTEFMAAEPYTLGSLASSITDVPRAMPKQAARVGLGRNVTLFDDTRAWAYSQYKNFTSYTDYALAVKVYAETMAVQFAADPLPAAEVSAIARSVSKWVWRTFDAKDFSARQSRRRKAAGHKTHTTIMNIIEKGNTK